MTGFTVKAPLPCPAAEARYLAAGATLCAARAAGERARVLWPNHVTLDGRPVCDVSVRAEKGALAFSFAPAEEADIPAFEPAVRDALARMLESAPDDREMVLQHYCDRCDTLMKFVDVTYRGMPVYGFAFAVDRRGGLMVMTQVSRTVVTVYSGEAAIVREDEDAM